METNTLVLPDRRQIYRPFLERLGQSSARTGATLIVTPPHDPRDPDQPPIHVAFTNTAELSRGAQMALVGGVGSGKTTELQLTLRLLKRHADALSIYLDLAELTDINQLNPGAIVIAIGMQLFRRLKRSDREDPEIKGAHNRLKQLALGTTDFVQVEDLIPDGPDDDDDDGLVPVRIPGMLQPRFPALQRQVVEIVNLAMVIATPLLAAETQITILIDGLDRLIRPERFREFAEQDLRALRALEITIIVAAPLLMWFDKARFIQEYFDEVRHIPAAAIQPDKSDFLNQILVRRGATDLMDSQAISDICHYSGGVLRDLITLARTSAETAYRDDKDRIGLVHVRSASRQLGKRYLVGLGTSHKKMLAKLRENQEFSTEMPLARQLLVNRQVLDYCTGQGDSFAVHPALAAVLPEAS